MNFYPSLEELLQLHKENGGSELIRVYRSFRSIFSNMFWFVLTVAIVYLINVFFYDFQPPQNIPVLRHLSLRWLAIVPIGILLEILRKHQNDLYTFETHRITHFAGRLSLNYSVPVIRYLDIRLIMVHQDLIGRILDYGDVELGTAAEEGNEVKIRGIRSPKELAQLIDRLRTYSFEASQKEELQAAQGF